MSKQQLRKALQAPVEKNEITGVPAGLARSHKIMRTEREREAQFLLLCSQIRIEDLRQENDQLRKENYELRRELINVDDIADKKSLIPTHYLRASFIKSSLSLYTQRSLNHNFLTTVT